MRHFNNAIYMRRSNKIGTGHSWMGAQDTRIEDAHIVTALKNLESLGYVFSPELVEAIKENIGLYDFKRIFKELITFLTKEKGAHVKHAPMYPNFPEQVASASDVELYVNAFVHYFGDWLGVRIMPVYDKAPREALTEFKDLTVIGLGNYKDFDNIFTTLLSQKVSFSETDIKDVEWFIKERNNTIELIPEIIPNKENLATLIGATYGVYDGIFYALIERAQTATDVLRIYAAVSKTDVSLSHGVRFANIPKRLRRALLTRLEAIADDRGITEDMLRYKALWKVAGEKLHPGEYRKLTEVGDAFNILRHDLPFVTFRSSVEGAIKSGDTLRAAQILKARPGEFARRLDQLLRLGKDEKEIISIFASEEVVMKISTPVLWQMREHFAKRTNPKSVRAFFPKGQISKVKVVENTLTPLDELYTKTIVNVIDQALTYLYQEKSPLGKVFIDPKLKGYAIPTSVRSGSRAINTVGRGSHVPYDAQKNLRLFVWWTDGNDRTDLDLSAVFLDKNNHTIGSVAYTNLRQFGAVHSGDITSAPNGASEYIDLPIEELRSHGVRYVMMVVNSFTNQPFYELPECFAGFMSRDEAQKGEVYEPRTLENIFDITSDTQIAVPLILDLKKSESIWTDLSLKQNPAYVNNIHANADSLSILNAGMVSLERARLFDLFRIHTAARGELVSTPEEADTVFTISNGRVSVNAEEILAEYL